MNTSKSVFPSPLVRVPDRKVIAGRYLTADPGTCSVRSPRGAQVTEVLGTLASKVIVAALKLKVAAPHGEGAANRFPERDCEDRRRYLAPLHQRHVRPECRAQCDNAAECDFRAVPFFLLPPSLDRCGSRQNLCPPPLLTGLTVASRCPTLE